MSAADAAPSGFPRATAESSEVRRLRVEHAATVQALQSAIQDTTRLMRLFFVLSETAPLAQLLDRILATVSELFMTDIVVLLEANQPHGFTTRAALGLPTGDNQMAQSAAADRHAAAALQARKPMLVAHTEADPHLEPYLRELGAESVAWLPVIGDQAPRGVLVLARCRRAPFVRTDIDLLVVMTHRIGLVLDRAHADQEQQMLATRIRRAEKAESLGRMAAAIAHHFNNMLATVVGSLDVALRELPEESRGRDDLTRAREAARRAGITSGLMLAYLGQRAGGRELLDLGALAQRALSLLRTSFPRGVRLTLELGDTPLVVLGDSSQLTQAFTNIVVNALEAIGPGPGEVRVTAEGMPAAQIPPAHHATVEAALKAESYVCLTVTDTGGGMAPETLEKIFDPFFSTKLTGRGLGLPVALGTLQAHNGFVHVDSSPGRTTTVRMYLPRSAQPVPTPPAPDANPKARSDRRLVLLAEDEVFVLETTRRGLQTLGYDVITAVDGIDAVARFREHQHAILCVLLDVTMPRMDGWAALEAIRALAPDVPAVLASGYDSSRVQAGRPAPPAAVFLRKPYGLDELYAALQQSFANTSRAPAVSRS